MTSIDTIVTHLRQAVEHLHEAVTLVRGARDMAEELRDRFEELGTHDLVERMQGIVERADQIEAILLAGIRSGERLIDQAEAVRHGGVAGSPDIPARTTHTSSLEPPTSTWKMPILAGPDGLDRVLDRLPKRENTDSPTHGYLFREGGRPIPHGGLRSFRDPSMLAELDLPWKAARSEAMASHVEAKAAKMMRDGSTPRHATLVINNADGPCGWLAGRLREPRFGTSCDELLSDVLPADSALTVRWRDGHGVEHSQLYRGTGRGIRR